MKLGVACDGWVIVSSDDIEEIAKLQCEPVEHEGCSVCDPLEIITGIPCYKTVFVDELPDTGISGILYVTKTDDEYSIYEWNGSIFVNVTSPESCTLQTKTVTPSLSAQTVLPDPGYSGMSEVDVDAVQRGELDEPTIAYIELPGAGAALLRTAAWVAVSGWLDTSDSIYKLFNVHDVVPSQAGTTITPTTSTQLAVAKFKWTTGPVYVAAIPPEYVIPSGTKNIVANGNGIDVSAYEFVDVAVPASAVDTGTKSISTNGTHDVVGYASASVNVPASAVDSGTKSITANGNNQDVVGYAAVNVNVPNSYGAGDEGKVVSSGALVSQTSDTCTSNGVVDTTLINSLTVNVSGGGGATLVASAEIAVNTTSTSATAIQWVPTTSNSQCWTTADIVYVKIRDKAGPRGGYFYGSDNFFINYVKAAGVTSTNVQTLARLIFAYNTNNTYTANTSGYGVYAYQLDTNGRVQIYRRYNSNYSKTINGTFKVDVYLIPMTGLFS